MKLDEFLKHTFEVETIYVHWDAIGKTIFEGSTKDLLKVFENNVKCNFNVKYVTCGVDLEHDNEPYFMVFVENLADE